MLVHNMSNIIYIFEPNIREFQIDFQIVFCTNTSFV